MKLHKIKYITWKAIQAAQANSWHVYRGTSADHTSVGLYCGNRDHVFTCEVDGVDEADWTTSLLVGSVEAPTGGDAVALAVGVGYARLSSDGSMVVKSDPGTASTKPEYYTTTATVNTIGVHWIPLVFHNFWVNTTKRAFLQGVTIQLRGHVFGDKIALVIKSDGLNPALGPLDWILMDYKDMNVPLGTLSNGWSHRIEEPDTKIGSASELFPGMTVWARYTCASAGTRDIAIDLISQEE